MRDLTVMEATELWLWPDSRGRYIGPAVTPEARERRVYLARYFVSSIGAKRIADVSPDDIHQLQQECTALGLMPGTVNAITHAVLMALVRDMARTGYCPIEAHSRLQGTAMLRVDNARQWRSYTIEERDAAIDHFAGCTSAGPLVAFLLLGGMRGSEAAGLQERDIDWRRGTIAIERARRGRRITLCKEEGSQRDFPASDRLLDALRPLRGRDAPFFFPGDRTPVLSIPSFRRFTWYPGLARAGLRRIRLHHCRHVWASIALENGVTLAEVAAQLGDTMATVSATYAHVRPTRDANVAIGERPPPARAAANARPSWLRVVK